MRVQNLKDYNNIEFNPGNKLKVIAWYLVSLIFFESGIFLGYKFFRFVLRGFGAKIGDGVKIKPSVKIKFPWKLDVGDYTWIGEKVWIDNQDCVSIGEHVCISQGAYIFCGNHDFRSTSFNLIVKPVVIESESWIGAQVLVCPGVTIKRGSVISAGLRVVDDVPSNVIVKVERNMYQTPRIKNV